MAKQPKFKIGDIVISGPYVIRLDGGRATHIPGPTNERGMPGPTDLSKLSAERGPHMIVARVMAIGSDGKGIHVKAMYLEWDKHLESAETYNFDGVVYLPADSEDYHTTRLYDREADSVDDMIAFLVVDALGKDKP